MEPGRREIISRYKTVVYTHISPHVSLCVEILIVDLKNDLVWKQKNRPYLPVCPAPGPGCRRVWWAAASTAPWSGCCFQAARTSAETPADWPRSSAAAWRKNSGWSFHFCQKSKLKLSISLYFWPRPTWAQAYSSNVKLQETTVDGHMSKWDCSSELWMNRGN